MADRKFAIRFSVEDMEKVRASLKNMGDDGASALRAIERQSRQATPAMKAVDTAVRDVRGEFDALANRIPIIGGALSALGPVGVGVAAGLAGIVLGFNAIATASRQAIEDIGRLQDSSERLALSVEDLQSIRGAGMLSGIDSESMDAMLATLATNSARASEGFGRMKAALDRVNPELSRQIAISTSQAERMDILARATQEATSYNEKLNIAVAAFGTEGGKMVAMLNESGAAMDTWRDKAIAAGLVLDQQLVSDADALGDRLATLEASQKVAAQRLAVSAGPLLESMQQLQTNFTLGLALAVDETKPIAERQLYTLIVQHNRIKELIKADGDFLDMRLNEALKLEEIILRKQQEYADAAAASAADAATAKAQADIESFEQWLEDWYIGFQQRTRAEAEKAAQEAKRRAEEAARLREQQEKAAIEIRASLGDWTGKLAAEEARLNALVAAGTLSREAMNASLAKTRAELDGSGAALERWRAAVQSTETPVEKAQRALEEFVAEAMKIGDRGPEFQAALRFYSQALTDAKDAAREATPEFKAVAEAREKITAESERMMSNQQKLDAFEAKQRALIGVNGYTWGEATKAIAAYRAELDRASQSQRENTFELRFSAEVLTGIIDENINSLEDLGKVALRVFRQMAVEWILANQKMAAGQTLWDFVGNAFAGAFGGGSGASAPAPSYSAPTDAYAFAGVHHAGRIIGSTPVDSRMVNAAMFIGAPRAHTGLETLRAGERPIIAEDGERMLSRVDNARVVRAIEAGAGGREPRVEVHIHGAEGKPEVKQSRGADGGLRIDVMMHKAALNALASPDGARVMASHYAVPRAVRS